MSLPRGEEEEPAEVLYHEGNENQQEQFCSTVCGCGGDDENQWTLTRSMACLVASGCVVLPSEDFEEAATETRPIPTTKPPPAVKAQ